MSVLSRRYGFSTYGLSAQAAEARLQFGAWVVEGGVWTHSTIHETLRDRDHLRRCGRKVGKIVRSLVLSGRVDIFQEAGLPGSGY